MRYGSVCSGIEAASVAWSELAWEPAFFSEIAPFPRAVLAHHYPAVPCHGDFTTIGKDDYGPINLLVGGTPCQSFSVAGLRGGLGDDRGNLALEFLRLADRKRPKWLVWENVPGVLSSNAGRDFGSILGGMVGLGYDIAYRILDAQYFGVPQRRRRVFVVGYFGDARRASAVLFERASLSGHPAPRRESGQVAPTIPARSSACGGFGTDFDCDGGLVVNTPSSHGGYNESDVAVLRSNAGGASGGTETLVAGTLMASGAGMDRPAGCASELDFLVGQGRLVRRLTPTECERLQGFPDSYTDVPFRGKPASDSSRYKALGNSMAVPVMRWIGERIAMVEKIAQEVA